MTLNPVCCGSGTCIVNAAGRCWCGQQWDGQQMCDAPQLDRPVTDAKPENQDIAKPLDA